MKGSSISTLFLLNPTLKAEAPKPTDEEETLAKVLYYYPESAQVYEIQSNVGLAEGLMMFVRQFTERPLESCTTERHTHIIKECEPDIWLYIVIQHPESEGFLKEQDLYCTPEVMNRVLDTFYQNFYLFHGPLGQFKTKFELEHLKELLSDYSQTFLCEFLTETELFPGFYYCPLDRKGFLMIQYMINQILTERKEVKHILMFYEGHYISSTLPHAHSCLLYRYFAKEKDWRRLGKLNRGFDVGKCQYMRIVSYPERGFLYGATETQVFTPFVHFPFDGSVYQLVAWVEDSLQYILLFEPSNYSSVYLGDLGQQVSQQSVVIRTSILKQFQQALAVENPYKYFYYNNMNFAIKKGGRFTEADGEVLSLIRSVTAQFNATSGRTDTMVKSIIRMQSGWVFCFNSMDSRQVFLLFPGAANSLAKVEEEVNRFVQEYLQNIFLGVKC